jgi:hypothetical protein
MVKGRSDDKQHIFVECQALKARLLNPTTQQVLAVSWQLLQSSQHNATISQEAVSSYLRDFG